MSSSVQCFLLVLFTCCLIIPAASATNNDTLDISYSIRDGVHGETLVSSGGRFELGFFSPRNSTRRYLGIWYSNISVQTVVWVANGQVPLENNSGVLRVTGSGNLTLFNDSNSGVIVWSTNVSRFVQTPTAQLLDSGNLVVKDATANNDDSNNFLWQSFEGVSDSYLPGMGFGWNFVTMVETYIRSWRSNDDPAPGVFTSRLDPTGYPQLFRRRGQTILNRVGPWNGARFSGAIGTRNNPSLRMNSNEVKYMEENEDPSVLTMLKLVPDGVMQRWTWNYQTNSWTINFNLTKDECDRYNLCGPHTSCNIRNSPDSHCRCLDRFVPRNQESWRRGNWSDGCVRRTALSCRGDDVFLRYSGIKLPDARNCSVNGQITLLSDCEAECTRNCSCTAYTVLDIRESVSGCLFYHGELIDIKSMEQGGQDLYVRLASADSGSKGKNRMVLIASLTSVAGIIAVSFSIILFHYRNKKKKKKETNRREAELPLNNGEENELPFFSLSMITKATDHFSIKNKLGEGGFGPVYKGILENGQEIAVKCLSKTSSQGVDELKNEVILVAKLQHRNLVRLLGCCIERDDKMLVYEFVPNSSLDLILFDQTKSKSLDWRKRFNIINGIAKGLLYLHQDSRLRIIHRDLKASNVLLDADMNPKISDFGLARSFGGNETEAKTRRVVGTYGYMAPEYAIDGLFSVKSDVFSFGVLVLEIVSGKRNRGFNMKDHHLNLLGHAWTLYKEGSSIDLVDQSLGDSFDLPQVLRLIQVGLLCVQKRIEDRPSMSSVVFMLGNEVEVPQAKQPGFFTERDVTDEAQSSSGTNVAVSENHVTITLLEGR